MEIVVTYLQNLLVCRAGKIQETDLRVTN